MPRAASNRGQARSRRVGLGRGMVLSGCRPESAVAWAKRGLAALTVAPLDGWTVVVAAGRPAARAPFDDAIRVLAGRPVGLRMRPALGFFLIGQQAVITVHPQRWRAVQRWVVWTPRDALVHLSDFPPATASDIVAASGPLPVQDARDVTASVRGILRDGSRDAATVLTSVIGALGLPGVGILDGSLDVGTLPGAATVTPRARFARAFDRIVTEEIRHREELEA